MEFNFKLYTEMKILENQKYMFARSFGVLQILHTVDMRASSMNCYMEFHGEVLASSSIKFPELCAI